MKGAERGLRARRVAVACSVLILLFVAALALYHPSKGRSLGGGVKVVVGSASASNLALALRLDLTVAANSSGAVVVSVDEYNVAPSSHVIPGNESWPAPPGSFDRCGNSEDFPIAFAVFEGRYTAGNYTQGDALELFNPAEPSACPTRVLAVAYYLFAPLSDNVSTFFLSNRHGENWTLQVTESATGYWTGLPSGPSFRAFPPGPYTVLAEDEWGDAAFAYFTEG